MTEQEIKSLAIKAAEAKGFKVTRSNDYDGHYDLETESEIIEIGTTTCAKATVSIRRFTKDGWGKVPTANLLINIGCRTATAERKINQII